jgi:chromosomal replication initiator protein
MYALKQQLDYNEKTLWDDCLITLRHECGESAYNSWLTHLRFVGIRDDIIILAAPSKLIREWVLTHYFVKIKEVLSLIEPQLNKIDIQISTTNEAVKEPAEQNKYSQHNDNSNQLVEGEKRSFSGSNLDKRFTFENFIIGDSNRLACNAAKLLASTIDQEASIVNIPLVIHGMVGNGKTHLMQAIAHEINQNYPHKNVAYLSAEKFMHQYIVAIKANNIIGFREKIRHIDCLLIDDIQFICGKASTQQEFARTINYFIEGGKRVVLSCDTTPYNLQLDSRSKSRLIAGMVVSVTPPDYDLRYAILQSKARLLGVEPGQQILEFIAQNIISSVREVEAALQKVISHTRLLDIALNLESCQNILGEAVAAHKVQVSLSKIINCVAEFYNVREVDITSKSREARFVLPRQVAAYLAKQLTDKSLQEIGYALGKRDHATIVYAVKKLEKQVKEDEKIAYQITQITDTLNK